MKELEVPWELFPESPQTSARVWKGKGTRTVGGHGGPPWLCPGEKTCQEERMRSPAHPSLGLKGVPSKLYTAKRELKVEAGPKGLGDTPAIPKTSPSVPTLDR